MELSKDYLKELKTRAKDSHVSKSYQMIGLDIAKALGDERHKALYIKLAKEHGGDGLLQIAKGVADRSDVKNKGAYFMRIVAGRRKTAWDEIAAEGEDAAKNLFKRPKKLKRKRKTE